MPKLNDDGLVPGQPVDFETVRKVEAERAKKKAAPAEEAKQARGAINAKKDDAAN